MPLRNHPILCNYYVTYRCNARCSFCDIWEKPSPYVSLSAIESNLRALRRLGVQVIDFTGGEPLLFRQLPEALALAKQYGFITTVTTNTLLYPKYAHALVGLVDMLHFSLDAATPELHDKIRGVKCFSFVLRSLDIAQELGERPDILFTVTDQNINEIEKVYYEIALPRKLILILNPVFSYNGIHSPLSLRHFSYLRKLAKLPYIYLNEAFLQLRERGGNHIKKPICHAASTTIVISPFNELVLPCYHLGIQKIPIQEPLDQLWRSQEVQKLVKLEGKYPACEGCTINCYMQPTFANYFSRYFFYALPSTLKYIRLKWGVPRAFRMLSLDRERCDFKPTLLKES